MPGQFIHEPRLSFLGYGWGFLLASPGAPLYLAGVPLGGGRISHLEADLVNSLSLGTSAADHLQELPFTPMHADHCRNPDQEVRSRSGRTPGKHCASEPCDSLNNPGFPREVTVRVLPSVGLLMEAGSGPSIQLRRKEAVTGLSGTAAVCWLSRDSGRQQATS